MRFLKIFCFVLILILPLVAQWGTIIPSNPRTQLNSISMVDTSFGCIVGRNSTILIFNGTNWVVQQTNLNGNFKSVKFINRNFGFAVGQRFGGGSAIIKHLNGIWTMDSLNDQWQLNSVSFIDSTHAWTVGDNGIIYRYNGSNWVSENSPLPSGINLNSVFFTDTSNGWAVGQSGQILRYKSGIWSLQSSIINFSLNSAFFHDTTIGWAVGEFGTILEFSNNSWTKKNSTTSTSGSIYCAFFEDPVHGWFANGSSAQSTSGSISRYNSINNTGSEGSAIGRNIMYGIDFEPTHKIGFGVGDTGTIVSFRFDWKNFYSPRTCNLNSVHSLPNNQAWAVGDSGTIMKFDTSGWKVQNSGTKRNLNSVCFLTQDTGIVVGDSGTILFFNGLTWTPQLSNTTKNLNSVYYYDKLHIWVAGDSGTILMRDSLWKPQISNTYDNLYSINFDKANHGWAVGANNKKLLYDGNIWSVQTGTLLTTLYGVQTLNNNLAWAVGNTSGSIPNILLFNGTSWNTASSGVSQPLKSIDFLSSTLGYAVGEKGTILKYTISTWGPQVSATKSNLKSISLSDSAHGWAVGEFGAIVRLGEIQKENISTAIISRNKYEQKILSEIDGYKFTPKTIIFHANSEFIASVILTNCLGKVIFKNDKILINKNITEIQISRKELPRGIYFIMLVANNKKLFSAKVFR